MLRWLAPLVIAALLLAIAIIVCNNYASNPPGRPGLDYNRTVAIVVPLCLSIVSGALVIASAILKRDK